MQAMTAKVETESGRPPELRRPRPRVGGYELRGPSIHDTRLHISMLLFVVHVCGQVWFAWELSIPQVLISWLTCATIEIAVVARRDRVIAWPASALLTGNGIALLLRATGTVPGDWWSLNGWYYFFGVAAAAMLIKRFITIDGRHIFNPANVALVSAFWLLGTDRVNPQDFWFGPMSVGLALTYVALIGGGTLITRRLGMFHLTTSFLITFAVCLSVLAFTGHAMSARWSVGPSRGMDFWWTIVTSPEVLIFAFFMITDPRTTPGGRVGRLVFGTGIGVTSVLLMAPQGEEFGAKVGFLAGLTVWNMLWPLIGHRFPSAGSVEDNPSLWLRRQAGGRTTLGIPRLAIAAVASIALVAAIAIAGIPARTPIGATERGAARPQIQLSSNLPAVERSDDLQTVQDGVDGDAAEAIVVDALENLEIERLALADGDIDLASSAATGDRLTALRTQVEGGAAAVLVPENATFERAILTLARAGHQAVPRLALELRGFDPESGESVQATLVLAVVDGHYLIADLVA